jgi:exodeoxyribonuclease VII large subunit
MARGRFDALKLDLADGERVHVFGRPELYEQRAEFKLRALTVERFGVGAHLAALERLKTRLAAEGLFAEERKRPLPFLPRRIGVVTGNDAAAKRDVVTTIRTRFPPASVLVAETYVQGTRAAPEIVSAMRAIGEEAGIDVVVLTRGGGSFEDLLAFSDERVVRAVADCPVPVVSAVGHEQDTPLCDLAADVRASTPTAAGKLVVPELNELCGRLDRAREALTRNVRRSLERDRQRLARSAERLRAGPRVAVEQEGVRLERAHERLRGPGSRSSASGRRSRTPPPSSLRCHRCKHSGEGTRSSGQSAATSSRRRGVSQGARRRTSPRRGFGARVEEVTRDREAEPTFEQAQAELEQIVERSSAAGPSTSARGCGSGRGALRLLPGEARRRRGRVEELARRAEQSRPADAGRVARGRALDVPAPSSPPSRPRKLGPVRRRHNAQHRDRQAFAREEEEPDADADRRLDRLEPEPVGDADGVRHAVAGERGGDRNLTRPMFLARTGRW